MEGPKSFSAEVEKRMARLAAKVVDTGSLNGHEWRVVETNSTFYYMINGARSSRDYSKEEAAKAAAIESIKKNYNKR